MRCWTENLMLFECVLLKVLHTGILDVFGGVSFGKFCEEKQAHPRPLFKNIPLIDGVKIASFTSIFLFTLTVSCEAAFVLILNYLHVLLQMVLKAYYLLLSISPSEEMRPLSPPLCLSFSWETKTKENREVEN